jgi:hypothetical protein
MLLNPRLTPAQQRTLAPRFSGSTAAAQSLIGFARPFFVRTREWRLALVSRALHGRLTGHFTRAFIQPIAHKLALPFQQVLLNKQLNWLRSYEKITPGPPRPAPNPKSD